MLLTTASLLVSVAEARELSLIHIEDDVAPIKNTTLKRRTGQRQAAEAKAMGSNTIERAMVEYREDTISSSAIDEDDSNADFAEEEEEERLHRERREMFFRNLQLDAGGTTSLSLGTTGFPTDTSPFFDMSLSMEPFFDGETRSSEASIDLLNLRDRAYDYAKAEGDFLTGQTKSKELDGDSKIDLLKLRTTAIKYHEQQEALARETYLRNGIRHSQKQA